MSARVIGWDMNAALAMGDALGIDRMAVAEILPAIEEVAVAAMNQRISDTDA